ncbi:MAG: YwaF family protein [Tissierellia bacterium]|nr:YwaF family protein [Tissierellia bacterium]
MNIFLGSMFSKTSWKMDLFKSYGWQHILIISVGLFLCVYLAYRFRKFDEKQNNRLLFSLGIFLLVSEIYKQLFYYYHIGNGSYQWWIFPFQLCSVPMYLLIILPFIKNVSIKRGMYNFMATYNLLGGFLSLFEPSGLIHEYITLTTHAFIWHLILVFVGFYLIASNRCLKDISGYKYATYTFLTLSLIAFTINLLLWNVSKHTINMFFVGPANNPIMIYKDIASAYGWKIATLIYIPTVCLGAFIVFYIIKFFKDRFFMNESIDTI